MDNLATIIESYYPSAQNIEQVEDDLLKLPQVDCPVTHKFSDGLYIRELFMPAGTFAIGHHQNFRHFNVMLKGKVLVLNADGTKTELTAPMSFTAEPGRKIGYVIEDMVWQNIYPTNETDIDKLEAHYLTKSDTWQINHDQRHELLSFEREADRNDYLKMLDDLGVTHEQVIAESENEADQITLGIEECKVKIDRSPIQGKGLFATDNIKTGEIISLARYGGYRTQAGRYTNHALIPNAFMKEIEGNIYLIAGRDIDGCKGGELGEEITIDYRQARAESLKEVICQQ